MGFFLVFFPEEQQQKQQQNSPSLATTLSPILKRTNSNHIFTRTQSTISICAVLIFLTLILFTLSSFEPNNDFLNHHRRLLTNSNNNIRHNLKHKPPALQGLGTLYTRGTTAMHNLVLCHVSDHVTTKELKTFLRGYYFLSGLASKSDLLFIFNSISTIDSFDDVILQESDGYLKSLTLVGSDPTRAVKTGQGSVKGEPIWGKRLKMSNSSDETELTRPSFGSVVGFGVNEFDPENSLSGFMDHVPISLRRWAAYPMILGRVKRKFKHIILLDVNEVLLLGDPLNRVKSHSPESIFLSSQKNEKSHRKSHRRSINPAVVIGGERGVRRLSAAMLTEIVRSTTRQHGKKKGALTESGLLSQLVANEYLQKSIKFMTSDLIQEPSSLSGFEIANLTVVRSGNSNLDIGEIVMKHICSFSIDASVYTDC
ncbi:hypothetical protein Tco_1068953 [Tanacetum coccineum]|uniref:DUF7780 domain-containing protein n=1 Tax=Tanacetum coccineum TaxID=301880 RepID=A0ABQ5HIK9_9ASTR